MYINEALLLCLFLRWWLCGRPGKGMQSVINGLNTIYHVKETRNWLMTRIYAVFYTMCLVIALIVCLLLLVLGNQDPGDGF